MPIVPPSKRIIMIHAGPACMFSFSSVYLPCFHNMGFMRRNWTSRRDTEELHVIPLTFSLPDSSHLGNDPMVGLRCAFSRLRVPRFLVSLYPLGYHQYPIICYCDNDSSNLLDPVAHDCHFCRYFHHNYEILCY